MIIPLLICHYFIVNTARVPMLLGKIVRIYYSNFYVHEERQIALVLFYLGLIAFFPSLQRS